MSVQTGKKTVERLRAFAPRRPILFTVLLALALTLALELFSRCSLLSVGAFLLRHPVRFLANVCIVLDTLAVCHLFARRDFLLPFVSVLWLALGLVDFVMGFFRATPLSASDIVLLPSAFSVIGVYLDGWLIALLALALLAAAAGVAWVFYRTARRPADYKRAAALVLSAAALTLASYGATVWSDREEREAAYGNLIDAYDHFGFAYCFSTGLLDRGIDEPDPYSQAAVERVMSRLREGPVPQTKPDIVMVQLESFFDVAHLDDVSYEQDPIPVFRALKEQFSSGFLTVPSVGAGTANTEFEVLSGMSLDFFGMGEYPYMTVLQEMTCETVAADLKELGYRAHALHNNTGAFYSRNTVFSQLGFDTYTSLEFMEDVEYNPIGWAKDKVLTGEILQALDSSDDPQFAFAITVQGHGKYQRGVDSQEAELLPITWADDQEDQDALGYYLGQLRETDAFIGALKDALEARGRPAVLVLYGDHLPNFDIGSEQLTNGDVFQTEYVIWDNMGLPVEDRDLSAYQLSAAVLEKLGIGGGVLSRYHQQMRDRRDYQQGLELLEYDMLYGEYYCCGGENPYAPSDLQMGLEPLTAESASWADGTLTVTGEGFTAWSRITVDGDELDTVLTGDKALAAELEEPPEPGAVITVRQRAVNMLGVLAESGELLWQESGPDM